MGASKYNTWPTFRELSEQDQVFEMMAQFRAKCDAIAHARESDEYRKWLIRQADNADHLRTVMMRFFHRIAPKTLPV